MGMFDWYEPVPPLRCPFCDTELSGWQGKHGDNALFVWRQGARHPVAQRVDEDARLSDDELLRFRLPERFGMGTACPNDGQWLTAEGHCSEGVWTETTPEW